MKRKLSEEYDGDEDRFQSVIVELESLVSKRKKEEENEHFERPHEFSFRSSYLNNMGNNVKLPEIKIPKFDGDCTKWPEFRELFCLLIREKPHVPNVQKMQYLKMNLIGSAANVI